MKKLLSILGAIAFTASAASTVVACGSSSDSHKIFSKIDWGSDNNKEIITLADGQVVTVADEMNQASNKDDYILNTLDEMVAKKYANDYNTQNIATSRMKLVNENRNYELQNPSSNYNAYASEIDNLSDVSLSSNLFSQYTASLSGANKQMDQNVGYSLLNPTWYNDDFGPNGTGTRAYSLWYSADGKNFTRWTTDSEMANNLGTIGKEYLPTADQLNSNDFYLLKDWSSNPKWNQLQKSDLTIDSTKIKSNAKDAETSNGYTAVQSKISGNQALLYRFQDYLQSTNTSSMSDALNMEYAKNNMYRIGSAPTSNPSTLEKDSNSALYLDTTSRFASGVQSWSTSDSNPITSDYKMVWSISTTNDNAKKINNLLNGINNTEGSTTPTPLVSRTQSSSYSLINPIAGGNKDESQISKFFDEFKSSGVSIDTTNTATDPYFNMTGYQGIVKDGKRVDGGNLDIDSSAQSLIKDVEGFGILRSGTSTNANGGVNYYFQDTNKINDNSSFIIVMPVYLLDLLSGPRNQTNSSSSVQENTDPYTLQNIAKNKWVELNPQAGNDWNSESNFSGINYVGSEDTPFPTEPMLRKDENKSYIFIPTDTNMDDLKSKLKVNDRQLTIIDNNQNDDQTYGISGLYSANDNDTDKSLNGQDVKYKIHLGMDSGTADIYENNWTQKHTAQNINDIANMSSESKESLMDTLLYLVSKDDTTIGTAARTEIYHQYFSLDDIYYQGLYDKVKDYLKEDDSTDESD